MLEIIPLAVLCVAAARHRYPRAFLHARPELIPLQRGHCAPTRTFECVDRLHMLGFYRSGWSSRRPLRPAFVLQDFFNIFLYRNRYHIGQISIGLKKFEENCSEYFNTLIEELFQSTIIKIVFIVIFPSNRYSFYR